MSWFQIQLLFIGLVKDNVVANYILLLQHNPSQVHPLISPCPSHLLNFAKSFISSQCFSNPLSFNVIELFQYVPPSTTHVPFFKEFNLKTCNVIDCLRKMKKFSRCRSEIWNINFNTFKKIQVTFLPQKFDGDILFKLPPLHAITNMIE